MNIREHKARTEKATNLIGWRQTLTTSPPNHIRFLLVRAKKSTSGKQALKKIRVLYFIFSSRSLAIEKLRSCDDAFRKQLEKQKEVYEREIDRLTREKEEIINQSNQKVGSDYGTGVGVPFVTQTVLQEK